MKPVKTRRRYRCDFCSYVRAGVVAMQRHEHRCWSNPDRFCDECENSGEVPAEEGGYDPCHFCSQRRPAWATGDEATNGTATA